MSGGFSGVVRLSNVNDYIAPSQACIIPLKPTVEPAGNSEEEQLVGTHAKKPKSDKGVVKVSISLADCLACAGCVTSAETVLIEEQSVQRAIDGLRASKLGVVTVSASSLASICTARGWTMEEGARRLTEYFHAKGARVVLDSSVVQSLALRECWEEMRDRMEEREKGGVHRPLLVSACPGFVCYAEKSHGSLLLPLMSRIRSSQGVAGLLVKEYLPTLILSSPETPSLSPADIYHVAVMPCFDRKLEASRPENTTADGTRHVDCVLGTAELNDALSTFIEEGEGEQNMEVDPSSDLSSIESQLPEEITGFMRGSLVSLEGNLSGGYVEYGIDRWRASKGGAVRVEETRAASNLDVIRVFSTREGEEDCRPFIAARVYGFRNIQNMVRKLKTGKKELEYDLVEVMACPSGCANGGGQIRAATTQERNKVTESVEMLYSNLPRQSTAAKSIEEFRESIKDEKMIMDLKDVGATVNANLACAVAVREEWPGSAYSLPIRNTRTMMSHASTLQVDGGVAALPGFKVLKVLEEGGFGKVVLAIRTKDGVEMAIKGVRKGGVEEEIAMIEKRILKMATQSRNPFLLHGFGTSQSPHYIFYHLELVRGGELLQYKGNSFCEADAKFYSASIVLALEYLHSQEIAYMDLKLENVLVGADGYVKLADYGLCRERVGPLDLMTGRSGTVFAMAPEMLAKRKFPRAVDWWTLGIFLYEMLVGTQPFVGTDREMKREIKSRTPLFPSSLSVQSKKILERLLEKSPELRLGWRVGGAEEEKKHGFFEGLDWEKLYTKQLPPPSLVALDNSEDSDDDEEDDGDLFSTEGLEAVDGGKFLEFDDEFEEKEAEEEEKEEEASRVSDEEMVSEEEEEQNMQCIECQYTTPTVNNMMQHLRVHHSTTPALAGVTFVFECGQESMSQKHQEKCGGKHSLIRNEDAPIRRLGDAKARRCVGIEINKVPADIANEMKKQFESIMASNGQAHSPISLVRGNLPDPAHRDLIVQEATAIFVNNLKFSPDLHECIKEYVSDMPDGTRIITTRSLSELRGNRSTRRKTIDRFLDCKELPLAENPVSWSDGNGVHFYMFTVNRNKELPPSFPAPKRIRRMVEEAMPKEVVVEEEMPEETQEHRKSEEEEEEERESRPRAGWSACYYRTSSCDAFVKHLKIFHSTTLRLCANSHFRVVQTRDGPIRSTSDKKVTPQCVRCSAYPKTPYGYARHLHAAHKSTLKEEGVSLECECGQVWKSLNAKHHLGDEEKTPLNLLEYVEETMPERLESEEEEDEGGQEKSGMDSLPRQSTTAKSIEQFRESIKDEKMIMDFKDVGATVNANLAW